MVQELWENGVREIVLLDTVRQFGSYSRRLRAFRRIGRTSEALRDALLGLRDSYDRVIVFPTYDHQLVQLHAIREEVEGLCYLPFNAGNLVDSLDKIVQYETCERLGVPYPRSLYIRRIEDYDALRELPFPILLKPQHKTGSLMRPFELASPDEIDSRRELVAARLSEGLCFLASELVPGPGANVHAYVGFRTPDGRILGEWVGRKLSQHPNEYGVFASATNGAPEAVAVQGRTLVEGMDLQGIVEPEFKYDARDGLYKLTEINLRSMMWSRVGSLSGVPIHYIQYLYAAGEPVPSYRQRFSPSIHFVFLNNEVGNLVFRRGYARTFRHVMWGGQKRVLAVFDRGDLRPFLVSLARLAREIPRRFLERFRTG